MSPAVVIERNRENAQHSTGPKSEAGKAAASQNARKHGLSGKLIHKSRADAERYQKRIAELTRFYKLNHPMATPAIEAIATAEFRRTQAFNAEQNALIQLKLQISAELDYEPTDEELDGLARIRDAETTRLLLQLNRHYAAADRSWHKHLKLLEELKAQADAEARELIDVNAIRARLHREFGGRSIALQNEPSPIAASAEPRPAPGPK